MKQNMLSYSWPKETNRKREKDTAYGDKRYWP